MMSLRNDDSAEHHRWKGGGVFADVDLQGCVIGIWLKGVKVCDGESDSFVMDEEEKGAELKKACIGRLLLC